MNCFYKEEELKKILSEKLEKDGYKVEVAWGHKHGVDIRAEKSGAPVCMIEVKGCGSRQAMRVNYFLAIIGEILQRMDNPDFEYFIALPDIEQFRKLWKKLPPLAKERTKIKLILVGENEEIEVVL